MFSILKILSHFAIISVAAGIVLGVALVHPFSKSVKESDLRAVSALGVVKPLSIPPLSGWLVSHPQDARSTIVFIHGRSGNRMQMFPLAKMFFERGHNVVLWDQRHHGNSDGAETYGKYEVPDVLRVIDHIRTDPSVDASRISLVGFSLGAAMAIGAAGADTECRINAVVSDSPYASLRETGHWYIRLFGRLPAFLAWPAAIVTTGFGSWISGLDMSSLNPRDWATSVQAPVLLIHGEKDRRIPPDSSREIYARLPSFRKELWLVPGAGHTQAFSKNTSAYMERVTQFIDAAGPVHCVPMTTD